MKIKYKISFTGRTDEKLWNDGWLVSVAFRFLGILIFRYCKTENAYERKVYEEFLRLKN